MAILIGRCVKFRGFISKKGYGGLWDTVEQRMGRAHRIVFRNVYGFMPKCVLHACDHPWCVNPSHLWPGTQIDNIADMKAKGRGRGPRGESSPLHKVDESAARRILELRGIAKAPQLAARLKVSRTCITDIWSGRSWPHLPRENLRPCLRQYEKEQPWSW